MTKDEQRTPLLLRFRRFLRAHEYSLTLLGAVLVFATFVVKEAFRDHYKDIDDSISAARTAFLMHEDYFSLDAALVSVRVDELITRGFVQKEKNPYLAAVSSPHLVDDIQNNLTRWSSLLDSTSDLLASMPSETAADKTVQELRQKIEAANKRDRDYSRSMAQLYLGKTVPDKTKEKTIDAGVFQLNSDVSDIGKEIDEFARSTLSRAQQERTKAEKRYDTCTFVGYFTFSVGWLLAFVGRLAGIAGLGET